ncbi:glutathione S-transferase family protein [Hyaloraphidium curvatum]|nr:glutathione S-transferase family protein [Hyaloraphidium curvatum]
MTPTLYHCIAARSFRPLWLLEELRLPYKLVVLPFPPRAKRPEYLSENPLGTIPLWVDGGTRMTESAAITQRIAEGTGLEVAPGAPERGRYLDFVTYGEATLTFPQTIVLRYSRFEPERGNQAVAEDYARWFVARLRKLDAALQGRDYVCGNFTAADVSVGYALLLAEQIGLAARFRPAVEGYWGRLKAREGFRRAVERERRAAEEQGVDAASSTEAGAA